MNFTQEEECPLLPCSRSSKSTVMSSNTNMGAVLAMSTDGEAPSSEERSMSSRVNRKMDIALLPCLSLLYLFNGLDRSNVGNAETQGMLDLGEC
jgi:hypothetical protein